jgi:hypothetical protein
VLRRARYANEERVRERAETVRRDIEPIECETERLSGEAESRDDRVPDASEGNDRE